VLERLRDLDEVAYLRFASVYKGFDGAADFQRELVLMKRPAPSAARTNPAAEDEAVVL
jgi:transcriptional repressor NrdR